MKKMITLVAVLSMVCAASAATITWKSGTLKAPNADGTFSNEGIESNASGVYMLVSLDDYNKYSAMSTEELYAEYTGGKINATETVSGQTQWISHTYNKTTSTDFADGSTAYVVAIYTTTANDTDYYITNVGYSTFSDGTANNEGSSNLGTSVGKWTAVPEPTTVALLAIGMAALGLRRKIA